jgi:hypothetical protein
MSASMVATASVVRASSSSKLAGMGGTKTSSLTYPHLETSRGVTSGARGGQTMVQPRPIQATNVQDWQDFLSSYARVECHLAV